MIQLTSTAVQLARTLSESIGFPLSLEDHAGQVELGLFLFGTLEDAAPVLLWWLARLEPDPEWRAVLLAAGEPWQFHFEHMAAVHSRRSAAGHSQDILDEVDDAAEVDIEALVVIRRELRAASNAQGTIPASDGEAGNISAMLREGIELRSSLATRFPQNPEAHNELGSFLGMAGKNLRIRRLVDEGIMECKIAAQLLPHWDGPAVECGIMLANIGEYAAALRELEQARATLPEETPHLRFVTGYVLMMLERYAEALDQLEAVTEARPDFASAHRYAARCAFKIGDKNGGARHAKAGRQLGDFGEWTAWREGAYSSRKKGSTGTPQTG